MGALSQLLVAMAVNPAVVASHPLTYLIPLTYVGVAIGWVGGLLALSLPMHFTSLFTFKPGIACFLPAIRGLKLAKLT